MLSKLYVLICLITCSFGTNAQNTFTFSDTILEIGQKATIYGIYFNMNNHNVIVEEKTLPLLDSLTAFLKKNEDITFEIGVHTDTRGKEWANMKVSEFRAGGLRWYLIKEGINEDRLIAQPYGESEPVHSSNEINKNSETGKELLRQLHDENRRVVLKVLGVKPLLRGTFSFSDSLFQVGQTQTFQNIRFELNKPDLIHDSICQPYLDSIVAFCLAHPAMLIEIGVHTDSRGIIYRSFDLTGVRAESLSRYLIENGANDRKIVSAGYGAEKPIHDPKYIEQFEMTDPDKYTQLHQENRRVVLTILRLE